MTNGEKIADIYGRIAERTRVSGNAMEEENLSSAKWLYLKARYDTLLSILEEVERIINA